MELNILRKVFTLIMPCKLLLGDDEFHCHLVINNEALLCIKKNKTFRKYDFFSNM